MRFDRKAKLLVLGTARSEEMNAHAPLLALVGALKGASQLDEFTLAPLDAAEVATLAAEIAKRELEIAETMHLFHESEGNPLFVVEMVCAELRPQVQTAEPWRAFTPSPHHAHTSDALPPKLYAIIAGRFNQLSSAARELIGVAATIGRAFTLDVLTQAYSTDPSLRQG